MKNSRQFSQMEPGTYVFGAGRRGGFTYFKAPDVKASAFYAVTNYKLDKDYFVEGKKSVICGFDRGISEFISFY